MFHTSTKIKPYFNSIFYVYLLTYIQRLINDDRQAALIEKKNRKNKLLRAGG